MQSPDSRRGKTVFTVTTVVVFVVSLVLFGLFVDYAPEADAQAGGVDAAEGAAGVVRRYGMFQDIHIMVLIGFGMLMVYLRRNGYNSVGLNFMIVAMITVWSIPAMGIVEHLFKGHTDSPDIRLTIDSLIAADFAVATVLISYGAVLGKVTPAQLVWMGVFEVVFYAFNERVLIDELQVSDVGGSMVIHQFGAYFGIVVSIMIGRPRGDKEEKAVYHSDIFSMIGTLFLFAFWPSFNAALAGEAGGAQQRTVVNTVLALSGSCLASFVVSHATGGGRFDMVHIQNATLAGGVAVGSSANLMIGPVAAIIVGALGGVASTGGFAYLHDLLARKMGLHDTAGVHNLHGIPGVLGGLFSAIAAAAVSTDKYGVNLDTIYAARGADGEDRSRSVQAAYQVAAVAVTLTSALVGGFVTGLLIRLWPFGAAAAEPFTDAEYFHTPDEETPEYHALKGGNSVAMRPIGNTSSTANLGTGADGY